MSSSSSSSSAARCSADYINQMPRHNKHIWPKEMNSIGHNKRIILGIARVHINKKNKKQAFVHTWRWAVTEATNALATSVLELILYVSNLGHAFFANFTHSLIHFDAVDDQFTNFASCSDAKGRSTSRFSVLAPPQPVKWDHGQEQVLCYLRTDIHRRTTGDETFRITVDSSEITPVRSRIRQTANRHVTGSFASSVHRQASLWPPRLSVIVTRHDALP